MTIGNIRGHLASISNHHIKHISKIDCWTTQLGARVRITVSESYSAHTIHQLCHQSSVQQLTHTQKLSTQASNDILTPNRLCGLSETCITTDSFKHTVCGFNVLQHSATVPEHRDTIRY
ncbi:hypothetical protein BDEG_22522 [Batrachochytrium dendrobatidis JEL423]|uniref:Uncharacterized protein n=1 Tax=Batrachochytrium dendrobatidis (strain JEL423) TaxID=403673 RepID=A0A177WFT0_BATDL|nr:hypothetical protein BDEG_22522 [Batrachochytrium dendrobatidis JEL423]